METYSPEGKRVLVIDDHYQVLSALEQVLETVGLEYVGAANGEAGIDAAIHRHPDLIICDYYMEGLNGLQVFQELRGHSDTAGIPFVLMSMDETVEDRALEAGVDGFVSKGAGDLLTSILQFVA